MWEGCWDLWPIKAMEEGSGEGVSSKPMSIESFPETDLSLPAVIDDQVDGFGDGRWCQSDVAFSLINGTKVIQFVTAVSYLDYRSSLSEGWWSDCIKTIKFNPKSL